ncbi:MAG: APC family permease [Gammaproteobacteria bacterium]|nr:APC family permease [Gammaproteobacteria bacterium]MCH9743716.1 APC family permease [Gammaproteobacteria bacterium]
MNLKRHIGTWGMLFAALGGIVGSGWLFGPLYVARLAGPAAILAWIIGGCLMMVVAMTFAELSSTFPMTGGTIRFLHLSHGPLVSFSMAWIGWLSSIAIAPIETMALLQYASTYLPWLLSSTHAHSHVLSGYGILAAAFLMLIMILINGYGVKLLSKTNSTVVILKIIVPVLTIIILLVKDFHVSNITHGVFLTSGWKGILTALPTAGVIFSFIGYSPAVQLAGEAKNPQRSVPIAIIGALSISIILYVVLQVAFLGALSPTSMQHGWQHLAFKGDAGPFVGLATGLGLLWLTKILYIDAAVSPFGTALIYTATASRLGYAVKENGYLPLFLHKLNKHGVPGRVLVVNYVLGLLLFLPFPTWQKLVSFLVSSLVFAYAVGPLSLLVLRKTLPNQRRPFKIPAAPFLCILAFYICNLIIYWAGWDIIYKMLITMLIGYCVLACYRCTKKGRLLNFEWHRAWWVFLYAICIGVISSLGSFGGSGLIPFGWDFLAIGLMSIMIFGLSYYCAIHYLR